MSPSSSRTWAASPTTGRAQRAFLDLLARHPNVHTDTSGVRRFDLLVEAVRRAGPHKVLFGTDGPWLHPGVELAKVHALGLTAARSGWSSAATCCAWSRGCGNRTAGLRCRMPARKSSPPRRTPGPHRSVASRHGSQGDHRHAQDS